MGELIVHDRTTSRTTTQAWGHPVPEFRRELEGGTR